MLIFTRCLRSTRIRLAAFSAAGFLALLCAALLTAWPPAWAAEKQGYKLGERLPQKGGGAGAYTETPWESLVPADWDPMRELKGIDLNTLTDTDPRAVKALETLRKEWDNAPVVTKLNGARIRIPGFVVPLDVQKRQVTEFLLVPYYGACIHTPPPPANQIIHVVPAKPLTNEQVMAPVWVSGTLETVRTETGMGAAGYYMKADTVVPYRKP
jgi:hypothetical protein